MQQFIERTGKKPTYIYNKYILVVALATVEPVHLLFIKFRNKKTLLTFSKITISALIVPLNYLKALFL